MNLEDAWFCTGFFIRHHDELIYSRMTLNPIYSGRFNRCKSDTEYNSSGKWSHPSRHPSQSQVRRRSSCEMYRLETQPWPLELASLSDPQSIPQSSFEGPSVATFSTPFAASLSLPSTNCFKCSVNSSRMTSTFWAFSWALSAMDWLVFSRSISRWSSRHFSMATYKIGLHASVIIYSTWETLRFKSR